MKCTGSSLGVWESKPEEEAAIDGTLLAQDGCEFEGGEGRVGDRQPDLRMVAKLEPWLMLWSRQRKMLRAGRKGRAATVDAPVAGFPLYHLACNASDSRLGQELAFLQF
jgi:hypothetical protein